MMSQEDCRVGVTGHRVLAEEDRIRTGIDEALRAIERAFPGRPLTVLSALAAGADRLAAEAGKAQAGRLIAVLPLPREEYRKDFATPESIAEFERLLASADEVIELPGGADRDQAYADAGDFILEHCDVMLAVWDGRSAQGRGGTGEIVARARERGMPLVIVQAGNRKPGTREPTSLGPAQGRVLSERLPGAR